MKPITSGSFRRGFALLELIVALVVSAEVLVLAYGVLSDATDQALKLEQNTAKEDRRMNRERYLRLLMGRIEVGTRESLPFEGSSMGAHFSSWCDSRFGWLERCRVTLAIEQTSAIGSALVLRIGSRSTTLRSAPAFTRLLYLQSAAEGGVWISSWDDSARAPLAIGVLGSVDTTILPIGERY